MFAKASNTAFELYQVRMNAEALVPEVPVESSHYFSGGTDYRTSPIISIS